MTAGNGQAPQPEQFYRALYRIRRVEEEVARIYPTDKIKSPVHLSIGQEAVAVGVCETLQPTDVVFGTYRGHAVYLAKGGDLRRMIAELYGKATGCAKGKGGSMHLIDVRAGVLGTSAVVGTTIPHAVGYAYARKVQKTSTIVASFFGDGAVDEGVFYESLNFAALKGLPMLFVCENNAYAIHSHQAARQPLANICDRARMYGIPTAKVDDGDVFAIHQCAKEAVDAMRTTGAGPRFMECMMYRWKEHVGPNEDFIAGYRSRSEAEPWHDKDQVTSVGRMLASMTREQIEERVEAEIRDAFAFAEASPFPDDVELYTDVFKEV
ncbi:MAG: thiamine pyrophosphate-dependent dehydrogenase E1 component subunit alpha [bacterium]